MWHDVAGSHLTSTEVATLQGSRQQGHCREETTSMAALLTELCQPEMLTSMNSSASCVPAVAAALGEMHKKGVKRLAHHFTSAIPGCPGPNRSTHSPPSNWACSRAQYPTALRNSSAVVAIALCNSYNAYW